MSDAETKAAATAIEMQSLPPGTQLGKVFVLDLPFAAYIERGAVDPASGEPALWYTYDAGTTEKDKRRFVVVANGSELDEQCVHVGMWWVGAATYHLFELVGESDGA